MRVMLIFACTLILLPAWALGQSDSEPAPKGDRLEQIGEHLKRVGAVQRAATAYADGLGLDGKSAKEALDVLAAHAFKCDIKLVPFGKGGLDANKKWVYWTESKPLISCRKSPTDVEGCVLMDLSVSAKWQDPHKPPTELLQQAPFSPVDIVGATCAMR